MIIYKLTVARVARLLKIFFARYGTRQAVVYPVFLRGGGSGLQLPAAPQTFFLI